MKMREAIKDMGVRGAPAIAISAALSLAVEVVKKGLFDGTSNDAVSFLGKKLDYLVSSRPTAVNLSDAAIKLKDVVSKTANSAADAKSVLEGIFPLSDVPTLQRNGFPPRSWSVAQGLEASQSSDGSQDNDAKNSRSWTCSSIYCSNEEVYS